MDEEIYLSDEEIMRISEAILYASGHMVTYKTLAETMNIQVDRLMSILNEYRKEYDSLGLPRGIQFLMLDKGCQLVTKEVYGEYVREALGVKQGGNLSRSSLETLAIVAYNQPVTKQYIEQVRGVDSTYAITVLRDRELIEEVGRMDVPGRPHLYATTSKFLVVFGLNSLSDLPTDKVLKEIPKNDEQLTFPLDNEENVESSDTKEDEIKQIFENI